jgi:hypothetical protein
MATYVTTEILAALDLTATEREMQQFARDAQFVPAARRDEALRCWLIARRIGAEWHLNIQWQALGGKNDAEIAAILDARVRQHQQSAGARALKRKYGEDAAADIIRSKRGQR